MNDSNLATSSLVCCVSLEWQKPDHTGLRRVNLKTANLRLMRNEFRELILQVVENKFSRKFVLRSVNVYKKFAAEGKASIKFQELCMMLFISNAPPSQLVGFLKHLFFKICGSKENDKVCPRAQLLAGKQRTLEEISPVTLNEVSSVRAKVKAPDTTPPTGKKRGTNGKIANKSVKRACLARFINPIVLTSEQKDILSDALSGKNIFFTGSAGTGKSFLLRHIIKALPPDITMATASTGVAACLIGGMTLHSFAGIGSGEAPIERCIQLASRSTVAQNWRKCKHLIIDEVSMVDCLFFEKMERVARAVRNNDRPFGGIQLILCGDFLQLPPVNRTSEERKFCFQSIVWDKCVHACHELTEVHRQSDPSFIDILQNIRIGRVTPEITEKLLATSRKDIDKDGVVATRLCSHTNDAKLINNYKLRELPGTGKTFVAIDNDPTSTPYLDQLTRVPYSIELKVGAQVMLMKNLNVSEGLTNGARGVVVKFDDEGFPVVRFRTKAEVSVKPEKWSVKGQIGSTLLRRQVPLQLAWAFSIHKSQGLTLDCVEVSLSKVFEAGQAYVALSRARSMDCLRVVDFDPKQVRADPRVLEFYWKLRRKMKMMKLVPLGKKK